MTFSTFNQVKLRSFFSPLFVLWFLVPFLSVEFALNMPFSSYERIILLVLSAVYVVISVIWLREGRSIDIDGDIATWKCRFWVTRTGLIFRDRIKKIVVKVTIEEKTNDELGRTITLLDENDGSIFSIKYPKTDYEEFISNWSGAPITKTVMHVPYTG